MTSSDHLAASAPMEGDNYCAPAETDQGHEEEHGIEEQALILTDDGASPAADGGALTSTSMLSYNTGHGDFCFSPLDDWEKKKFDATNEKETLWCMGFTGSNGVPFIELGGFQRYFYLLTFPFSRAAVNFI